MDQPTNEPITKKDLLELVVRMDEKCLQMKNAYEKSIYSLRLYAAILWVFMVINIVLHLIIMVRAS